MRSLSKFSMGVGDRFGREGAAQLRAFCVARDRGVTITRTTTSVLANFTAKKIE